MTSLHVGPMTNKIAIYLLVLIAALLAFDYYRFEWQHTVFLLRKFLDLIEWLAIWR